MHYHKIKMTAAAMAMAVLVTGNIPAAELNTATVSAKSAISAVLPAAGVGLVLNDGVSVSQIREEIKKRKEEKEPASRLLQRHQGICNTDSRRICDRGRGCSGGRKHS